MSFIAVAIGGSAIASVVGGVIGSKAAGHAADTQAAASNNAAALEKQSADEALAFQKQQYADTQRNIAPFIQSGTTALGNLNYLLGNGPRPGTQPNAGTPNTGTPIATLSDGGQVLPPGGYQPAPATSSLRTADGPYSQLTDAGVSDGFGGVEPDSGGGQVDPNSPALGTPTAGPQTPQVNTDLGAYGSLSKGFDEKFVAPTDVTEQNDPGYQFRLNQGIKALQSSAAAKGTLFSGGTGKALTRFGQDYGSNEYGNVYQRAYNEYATRANQFNTNQTNLYNRYANLAGMGQTSTNQLGLIGSNTANNVSNTLLTSAGQIGNQYNNAAAARASGYVGSANAITGALAGGTSALTNLALLKSLGGGD